MKIKWEEVADFLNWNKAKSLRKKKKLNQAQVAVGAGISIATLYMIEQGYDKKTTEDTKQKLADFFEVDVDDIFPSEMMGNITMKEHRGKKGEEKSKGFHELETLKRFVYDFKATEKESEFYRRVLTKMKSEDLGDLYQSGRTIKETKEIMVKTAKRYGIDIPKSLKK